MRVSYVTSHGGSRGLTSGKLNSITRLRAVKDARRLEPCRQTAKGAPAMADFRFLYFSQFRKRLAKRLVEKDRIVAKAACAARRVENHTARFIFKDLLAPVPNQCCRANETRRTSIIRYILQFAEQFSYAIRVRRFRPRIT